MSGKASLLPLPEELYLRSLTGRLVGEHLFDGYRRVAAIAYPDRICAAMAAAALTSYTYYAGYRDGLAAVFAYDEKIDETARAIASADFDIVYVAFGGEQKLSTVNEATVKNPQSPSQRRLQESPRRARQSLAGHQAAFHGPIRPELAAVAGKPPRSEGVHSRFELQKVHLQ
jgi:hypothetical protein